MKKTLSLLAFMIPSFAFSHSSELHTYSDLLSGHFFTEIDHIVMIVLGFIALFILTKYAYNKIKSDR